MVSTRSLFVASLVTSLLACSSSGSDGATASDAGEAIPDANAAASDGGATTSGDAGTHDSAPPPQVFAYAAQRTNVNFLCKVLNEKGLGDPTANHVQTHFNVAGADLGIPVVTGSDLHVFFGDTLGYKQIWTNGEGPDSVARIPLASVTADPSAVCRSLGFYVTDANPSVAHGADPTVERDFAGAYMLPPQGEAISTYIAEPAGSFANIPGPFEVPGGGLAADGKAYLFYAGYSVVNPAPQMRISYIARWDTPGSGIPVYQILRRFDALQQGELGGHFIQVAPVVRDKTVVLFGTGDYRRTGIYVARAPLDAITGVAPATGEEIYDPQQGAWKGITSVPLVERPTIAPTAETQGVGELSAAWVEAAKTYVLLYQREIHDHSGALVENRVVARFAVSPEGPWTEALTILDMADPAFQAEHCCATDCAPAQILHCDRAGLYGAYLLPGIQVKSTGPDDATLEVPFFVSTWDPYNVVVFKTSVSLHGLTR